MEEKNPRKLIFFAVIGVLVVGLLIAFSFFGAPAGKKTKIAPQELTIWEVGMDTSAFDPVIAAYKLANKGAAAVTVTIKKFASYAEYERILPLAMVDGNSPDIFVVSNDGGWNVLGRFVERLPASIIDPVAFRRDYPSFLVDDLLAEDAQEIVAAATGSGKSKKPVETATQIVASTRGVPVGYETLAVFYNTRKMRGVPDAWSGFPSMALDAQDGAPASGSDFSPLGLGLGTSVPGSADTFALLLAQQGIRGPKSLTTGTRVLESYQAFANSPENNLAQFAPQLRDGLTVLDLFVRGKVGAVVGFPSLARELEYASKRAATGEAKIILRSIRAGAVPQSFLPVPSSGDSESGSVADKVRDTLSVNLVRYRYWAVSKFAQHPDAAADFLAYLTTKDGQKSLAKAFPWLLPAHRDVLADEMKSPIAPDWKITKESFVQDGADLVSFDKSNPSAWDARLPVVLDRYDGDARKLLDAFIRYLSCVSDQSSGRSYDVSCLGAGQ